VKIRMFGSSDCASCKQLLSILKTKDFELEYIDALDDNKDIQDFCDEHDVDGLPHLQFIHTSGSMVKEIRRDDLDFEKWLLFFTGIRKNEAK